MLQAPRRRTAAPAARCELVVVVGARSGSHRRPASADGAMDSEPGAAGELASMADGRRAQDRMRHGDGEMGKLRERIEIKRIKKY